MLDNLSIDKLEHDTVPLKSMALGVPGNRISIVVSTSRAAELRYYQFHKCSGFSSSNHTPSYIFILVLSITGPRDLSGVAFILARSSFG